MAKSNSVSHSEQEHLAALRINCLVLQSQHVSGAYRKVFRS
jgi:hypothetical protein